MKLAFLLLPTLLVAPLAALHAAKGDVTGSTASDPVAHVFQSMKHGIVSQLRLLDNLGKDPVADKILFNLIHFASR